MCLNIKADGRWQGDYSCHPTVDLMAQWRAEQARFRAILLSLRPLRWLRASKIICELLYKRIRVCSIALGAGKKDARRFVDQLPGCGLLATDPE